MGLFLVYGVEGGDAPADDATGWTASNSGWGAFGEWAGDLPQDEFPELTYLAEYGEVFAEDGGAAAVEALEAELARALEEKPGDPTPEVLGVGKLLLQALRRRPADAVAAIITDGTGLDEDEEDDEGGDLDNDNGDGGPPGEEGDEEDQYQALEGVEAKGLAHTCGPACSCTGCKAMAADEQECARLQRELLALDEPVDFLVALLRSREAADGMAKALSAMAAGSGGDLVPPAAQGKDHLDGEAEEQLRVRLTELVAKREELRQALCDRCGVCDTGEGK
jgi:hypothetical protein